MEPDPERPGGFLEISPPLGGGSGTGSDASSVACPIDQRAVMVLHFSLDLPLTEAARVLEIPSGTAKSRLSRALEALRASMRAEPEARPVTVTERVR